MFDVYRAARRCTISIVSISVFCPGDHTVELYSSIGRTRALYAVVFVTFDEVLMFLLTNPSALFPLAVVFEICSFQLKLEDSVTPR